MRTRSWITTSWDDGHPLDLRLAELLCKYSLPATFYVPLRNDLPVLTRRQIYELSLSFEIGAHTVHHRNLLRLPELESRQEIADCKGALEQITGRPCAAFCFPYGSFQHAHLTQVRQAGYRAARTVELMSVSMPQMQGGIAILPTTVQALPAGLCTYARNSLRRLRPANFGRYLRFRRPDWVATAEALLENVLGQGGVFHLWGHSREIEGMGQWHNVERIFAQLAHCKDRASMVNNTALARLAGA